MRKVGRISLGVFLVIIGIIGWILPVIPGWPALIPGLLILGEYFPPIHRMNEKIKRRFFKDGKGPWEKHKQPAADGPART